MKVILFGGASSCLRATVTSLKACCDFRCRCLKTRMQTQEDVVCNCAQFLRLCLHRFLPILRPSSSETGGPMVKAPPMNHDDRHADAVTLLGLLRRDEDSLNDAGKTLVKHDRDHARNVFMHEVDGWTPFHAFVLRGARKMLKLALKAGVDVNLKMSAPDDLPQGCTALHLAAHRGDVAVINILVAHGAEIDHRDDSGRTPVVYASKSGNTLAMKTLQRAGADMRGCDGHKQPTDDAVSSPMICFLPFVCAGLRR